MASTNQSQILCTSQDLNVLHTSSIEPPQTVRETIKWLIEVLQRPPMPECPIECERDCEVPQGKAPAYLNGDGRAHLVKWKPYQERMPDKNEIKAWFSKTRGIGTLGGWNGKHYIGFVDLDHKSEVFDSYEAFLSVYENWMESHPILKTAPRFKTPSGGYRVIMAFTEPQDWVAFTLIEGMPRMGELLQKNGSHTLLPPSLSIEGKPYQWEHFTEYPPIVSNPQEVGIYPTRKNHNNTDNDRPLRQTSNYIPGALRLEDLGNEKAQSVLKGENITGDRSESLTVAAREWYGWENFCQKNGLTYNGTTEELAAYAWSRLDDGKDPGKWQRILKTVDPDSHAAAEHVGGDESCWKKIKRLDVQQYRIKCPDAVKRAIDPDYEKDVDAVKSEFQVEGGDRPKTLKEISDQPSQSDFEERYRQFREMVAVALQLSDPIERYFALDEIAIKFRKSKDKMEHIVTLLEQRHSVEDRKTSFTLEDFANMKTTGHKMLIPRFTPAQGLTMLAGFAKEGKSTLMYDMIRALVKGEEFLGEKPDRPYRVLLVQVEEDPELEIRSNLLGAGLLHEEEVFTSGRLRVETEWTIDDLDTLEMWAVEHQADIVFFDSLRALSKHIGAEENSPKYATPVYALQERLKQLRKSGILIHHFNKSKDARGLEKIAGTAALVGACNNIMTLMRVSDDREDARRQLVLEGRALRGRFDIEYVAEEYPFFRFDFLKEVGMNAVERDVKTRVFDVISTHIKFHPEGVTGSFIVNAMDETEDKGAIYKAIRHLASEGAITIAYKVGLKGGLYGIPKIDEDDTETDIEVPVKSTPVVESSQDTSVQSYKVTGLISGRNGSYVSKPPIPNNGDPYEDIGGMAVPQRGAKPYFRHARYSLTVGRYAPDGTDRLPEILAQQQIDEVEAQTGEF